MKKNHFLQNIFQINTLKSMRLVILIVSKRPNYPVTG